MRVNANQAPSEGSSRPVRACAARAKACKHAGSAAAEKSSKPQGIRKAKASARKRKSSDRQTKQGRTPLGSLPVRTASDFTTSTVSDTVNHNGKRSLRCRSFRSATVPALIALYGVQALINNFVGKKAFATPLPRLRYSSLAPSPHVVAEPGSPSHLVSTSSHALHRLVVLLGRAQACMCNHCSAF